VIVIAIDTNVLLRHLLDDEPVQSKKAHALLEHEESVLITDVVLAETVWTLKGKRYKATKDDIITVINSLLAEPNIVFEQPQVIWAALNDYRKARPVKVAGKNKNADFPDALIVNTDALIVNKARFMASQEDELLASVYTFDLAALEVNGTNTP
jgi:predicted nucleic-acid-binding protein